MKLTINYNHPVFANLTEQYSKNQVKLAYYDAMRSCATSQDTYDKAEYYMEQCLDTMADLNEEFDTIVNALCEANEEEIDALIHEGMVGDAVSSLQNKFPSIKEPINKLKGVLTGRPVGPEQTAAAGGPPANYEYPSKNKGLAAGVEQAARQNLIKNPDKIQIGQKLKIGGRDVTVKKGDTLSGLTQKVRQDKAAGVPPLLAR